MGRDSGKMIQHLNAGIVCSGRRLVDRARMPAQGSIQLLPQAGPRQIGFSRSAFFPGTAVEDHRTGLSGILQVLFYCCRRGKRSRSEQIVPASMPAAALFQRFRAGFSRFLAQTAEGIKLAEDADDRMSASVGSAESRFNIAEILRNRKAELPKLFAVESCGTEFFQAEFRIIPDLIRHTLIVGCMLIDIIAQRLFDRIHFTFLLNRVLWTGNPAAAGSADG